MILLMLLAALVVVATSAAIVIEGRGRGVPVAPRSEPTMVATASSPASSPDHGEISTESAADAAGRPPPITPATAASTEPPSEGSAIKTGYKSDLRD
jgi:hypothetical protein